MPAGMDMKTQMGSGWIQEVKQHRLRDEGLGISEGSDMTHRFQTWKWGSRFSETGKIEGVAGCGQVGCVCLGGWRG